MISRMLDGPAAGKTLSTRRAPMYLRVVYDRDERKWDVLDQVDDEVRPSEDMHVYAAVPETWSFGFVRPGGRYEGADYRECPGQGIEALRDNARWRGWAEAQEPIEMLSEKMKEVLEDGQRRRERYGEAQAG